jgi:Ca2+-binding RTX toxin-like protein
LDESYSVPKMTLVMVVIIFTLLLSTALWFMPAPSALAQTAITCYGFNATIVGSPGADHIVGTLGQDVIVTLGGSDRVHALDGDDIICGGKGLDTFIGGSGNDLLDGGSGNDLLDGGIGDDRLIGGSDNDTLFGEDGNDDLYGGALFGGNIKGNIDNGDGGPDFDTCVDVKNVTNCEG